MPGQLNHSQKHRSAIVGYAGDKLRAEITAAATKACAEIRCADRPCTAGLIEATPAVARKHGVSVTRAFDIAEPLLP